MNQLPLNIAHCLAYSPDNFVCHAGVAGIVDYLRSAQGFTVLYVTAGARRGKTHLSIKLADQLTSQGRYPRLSEGRDFARLVDEFIVSGAVGSHEFFIVDDAQEYLLTVTPGNSGPFVSFFELLRKAGAGIVFLSATAIEALPCDQHVTSRLIPGAGFEIGDPAEEDIAPLIDKMAKQRGLALKEREVAYLLKRIGRDIPSIEQYFQKLQYLSQVLNRSIRFPLLSDAV